jgi:hypothetical protein
MSRGLRGRLLRIVLSICYGLPLVVADAGARQVAPFRTALAVSWGVEAGSDAFRDDLLRSLAAALATGCFASVTIAHAERDAEGADLAFEVVLSNVVDETRFDDSIAGALQPGEPTNELRRVTYFEVTVDAKLTSRETGALVQRKHLVAHVSRRPVYVGEDAQATARAEAIDDIVHDLMRALGCGRAKLARRVREAQGDTGKATPGPR